MYLSRLILNPRSRQVQSELARRYEMHRTILSAFPAGLDQGSERVLWRLEPPNQRGDLTLLVQSWDVPDWSRLKPGYLLEPAQSKPFNPTISAGQTLAFRLLANPTVKKERADGKPTRQGILGAEAQTAWLRRKAEAAGFGLLDVQLSPYTILKNFAIGRGEERRFAAFLSVQYDGTLRVVEPTRFMETLRRGIGSAKGLGFGLLSIAPARMPAA